MTPQQYRARKDDLLRRERETRTRAQLAAEAVERARGKPAYDDAIDHLRAVSAELEDLMHETGEFD
jgi:hypothetical protein